MTQYNYNRRYSLSVTSPERSFPTVGDSLESENSTVFQASGVPETPFSFAYKPREDLIATTNTTIVVNNLQIQANVKSTNQTSGSDETKVTIKIYNLSKETKSLVSRKDNLIVLKAGYESFEDELPIVFSGQVVRHATSKEGNDIVTTLECGDGYTPITTARTSLKVPSGNTYGDVFKALAGEMGKAGVVIGDIITEGTLGTQAFDIGSSSEEVYRRLNPNSVLLVKGWSYSGKVSQALDDLCETFGHTWQIVHNRLFIHPQYYGDMFGSIVLNKDQIISIEEVEDGTATGSNPAEYTGLKIKILLDGRVDSSKKVIITSGEKEGSYPIRSFEHSLNYEGQDWYTTIECGGNG